MKMSETIVSALNGGKSLEVSVKNQPANGDAKPVDFRRLQSLADHPNLQPLCQQRSYLEAEISKTAEELRAKQAELQRAEDQEADAMANGAKYDPPVIEEKAVQDAANKLNRLTVALQKLAEREKAVREEIRRELQEQINAARVEKVKASLLLEIELEKANNAILDIEAQADRLGVSLGPTLANAAYRRSTGNESQFDNRLRWLRENGIEIDETAREIRHHVPHRPLDSWPMSKVFGIPSVIFRNKKVDQE